MPDHTDIGRRMAADLLDGATGIDDLGSAVNVLMARMYCPRDIAEHIDEAMMLAQEAMRATERGRGFGLGVSDHQPQADDRADNPSPARRFQDDKSDSQIDHPRRPTHEDRG